MKLKHSTKNLEEAIDVFIKELPDPNVYKVAAVIEHFEVAGKEIMLRAQKSHDRDLTGHMWIIENLNSQERIFIHR